ncbi:MAG: hypothetical protein HOL06_10100 [Rhodospirillaceae bacterium]|nr:hypothetical protein [Rhodospirillaceae bacterium]
MFWKTCSRRSLKRSLPDCRSVGLFVVLVLLSATLSACGASSPRHAEKFLSRHGIDSPTSQAFTMCYGYGCRRSQYIELTAADWDPVRELFTPLPADAEAERAAIQGAVALLEQKTGDVVGTKLDKGGSKMGLGNPYQLDCVDESLNTTNYLILMKNDGLLRFHDLRGPATRGFFIAGWPHTTAAIMETEGGAAYAVDSWFFDNGVPPVILPIAEWQGGWDPEDG